MKSWNALSLTILLSLVLALILAVLLVGMTGASGVSVYEFKIWSFASLTVPLIILIDSLSGVFLLTVLLISSAVFTFSRSYMSSEPHFGRFHLILLSFVGSMVILIVSPGLVSLFLGWDGLGLTSFLLVMFYNNPKSLNAAMLTVLTNRLGDAFILLSLILGLYYSAFSLPTLSLSQVNPQAWGLTALLVTGAFTKSAQVPFSAWLPAAMAAPTPVSSLVHSSTLVTAGVYVLIRVEGLLSSQVKAVILIIGALTMTMAGLSALKEGDMKKIVALSTLSQLGIMVMGVGLGSPFLAFFHLIAHAFFKALLFIAVGNAIHAALSYQDLKIMGNLSQPLPFTSAILLTAKASLCGLPFFSGFFSKEAILEGLDSLTPSSVVAFLLMVLGIMLTQLYTMRFMKKVMINLANFYPLHQSTDQDLPTNYAMIILILPAFTGGSLIASLNSFGFNFLLTSSLSKTLVVLTIFVSLLLMQALYTQPPARRPWATPLLSLWLTPQFSGQGMLLSLSTKGDYLTKSLSLGFIDAFLAPWLIKLSSKFNRTSFTALGALRVISVAVLSGLLLLMYL